MDTVKSKTRATQGRDLTVSTDPTMFGCEPLFDYCTDAQIDTLMGASFAGSNTFLDWIGWERTNVCTIKRAFINFVRPEQSGGDCTPGWVANPCADANSIEVDYCDFTLTDFARLRRTSPVRDITKAGVIPCEISPRYRIDGTPITNQLEYDMANATEVMLQDLSRMAVNGNNATPGQFSGLETLVRTGYTNASGSLCPLMDSQVVDWNGNGMAGGAGVTWNGNAVASTWGFIDVLMSVFRRIRQRIRMAPRLASQRMAVGDMILLMPSDFVSCVLDAFTCWSVCGGDWTVFISGSQEARIFRQSLNGGLFGAGKITVDGFDIPIMPYDWQLINADGTFDAYLLTGSVGTVKLIQGQYNDMELAANMKPAMFTSTDSGRLLFQDTGDHTCVEQTVEMQPRLLMWAPWAQARFMDISCARPGDPISADPCDPYFPYPQPVLN